MSSGMKVLRIQAHNVMGVKDIDFKLNGHHLWFVGGENSAGKSSSLRAFAIAMCGKRGCDYPDEPLRHGEDAGWVRVTTDGAADLFQDRLIIERSFEKSLTGKMRERLRIIGDDGEEAPEPQTLLNRLYAHRGLDPMSFLDLKPDAQLEALKDVVKIDTEKFEKKRKKLYDERTGVNRTVSTLEGKLRGRTKNSEVPESEIVISELTAKLREMNAVRRDNDAHRSQLDSLESDAERCRTRANAKLDSVNQLKAQLAAAEAEHEAAVNEHKLSQDAAEEQRAIVDSLDDPDTSIIESQIASAEETNKAIRQNAEIDSLRSELDDAREESKNLTVKINQVDADKDLAFTEAKWPVDGLSYASGKITFNGVPFKQCGRAEQIRVSFAMSIAANPELRLLIIQNGECMDNKTLAVIEKLALENDYQLLIEFMTRDAKDEKRCQVIIEDGNVREPVA